MSRILLGCLVIATLAVVTVFFAQRNQSPEIRGPIPTTAPAAVDYRNATYIIDDTPVSLVDGVSVGAREAESAAVVTTRYFGNDLRTDLNGDGKDDVVFLLTQEGGGSGTFFYVAAAVRSESGFDGSEAYFIGDRIAPQTIERDVNGVVVVNYADRADDEPMTVSPSVGRSLRLTFAIDTMRFTEVRISSEIEAGLQSLTGKTWVWQRAEYNDGRTVVPTVPGIFTLTFRDDGLVTVATDCDGLQAKYVQNGMNLTFPKVYPRATLRYCADSQEALFTRLLTDTRSYRVTDEGDLVFELLYDSGIVVFK